MPHQFRTLCCIAGALASALSLSAQTHRPVRNLITDRVDNTRLHRLSGNTRSEANAANDAGAAPDNLVMDHLLLQLRRSPEQEQAVQQLVDQLHDPKSPSYHRWLTPDQFGQAYGASAQDLATVKQWIESQGFRVNSVYPNGLVIDFSGTAATVRKAFHTEMHYLNVNGERHLANISDPQIPEALAPAVSGVVSMHDFTPHAMKRQRPAYTYTTQTSTYQALTPSDLATIYNLTPLFAAGYTGKGQTIAVIEDSDLYDSADWDTFRSSFGLSRFSSGSLTTLHPAPASGVNNCAAPGARNGDDGEAILDAEWASASAPDAAIVVAACANTRTTFGGLIALQNLVNSAQPPSIISVSYGECEAENGAASNAAFRAIYQQAVAQGISVFASAGDEGAASCDAGNSGATHGIGVSGMASTPYNVAVGGTDFADTVSGNRSTYWNAANAADFGSALSYIPEIPWNDSCASTLLAGYLGFASPYGADGLCSSATARQNGLLQVVAGGGGPSGCATGAPSVFGIVGGTCAGYDKPSWQSGLAGIPADGVRDIPDVSLFAGTGVWGHYYVMCWSNTRLGGAPCTGDPSAWAGAGGTSFSAPIVAGIQALVNQRTGSAQGNPNYRYYALAAQSGALCDSSAGDNAASACVFHNVTQGDIAVNCGGTQDCFGSTGATGRRGAAPANGALSLSKQSFAPAFGTSAGWNFATGIGSLNAFNLVMSW